MASTNLTFPSVTIVSSLSASQERHVSLESTITNAIGMQ
jgi:hypothetical protein